MKASLLFITYNHASYVAEAIRSAMAQDHPDIQLVICDDASTDATRAILEEELKSCPPHIQITWASPTKNVGLIANFNGGMAACTGDFIIPMSGDDISEPGRASALDKVFSENPGCMLATSDCLRIDAQGAILSRSWIGARPGAYRYAKRPRTLAPVQTSGATASYRTSLRDAFGSLTRHPYAEDTCYGIRGFIAGEVHFIADTLVRCRAHDTNLCNVHATTDTPEGRRRHMRMLRALKRDARQWRADIETGVKLGMIQAETGRILLALVEESAFLQGLTWHALHVSPWPVWREMARRLLTAHPSPRNFRKTLQAFWLRISQTRRNRYWRKRFDSPAA